jgi:lipoteichoic acid synthase
VNINQNIRKIIYQAWFLYFVIALMWVKTYIVQKFVFDLKIESLLQEFILFINPFGSLLWIFGFCLFVSERKRVKAVLIMFFLLTFNLYVNIVYYRFFNDFITLPVLFQTSNMGDLGSSVKELIKITDILFFVDLIIISTLIGLKKLKYPLLVRSDRRAIFVVAATVLVFNLVLAEIVRPQLLTRSFDREILVKNIGPYSYQLYDMFLQSKTKSLKVFANTNEFVEIENYVKTDHHNPNSDLYGVAKGKNVILISLESTQSFVINNYMDGHEITPFMNDLIKDSFYFENFYHQTGQGKTSDAEFIIDNSLYPLPRGAVFFTHPQNEYHAIPEILAKHNYNSSVFHANNKTFWNRDIMYETLGYDQYYAREAYDISEENSAGWGLKDIDFFNQSIPYLKELPQPFYAKLLTLTNHHPFRLDEKDMMIPEFNSVSGTLNRYFSTVRYADEALKIFFERLKEEGLYEDSIIIIYGDHYGISPNHNTAMGQYLGKEITPFETIQLQRVPLIIHVPGMEGETIDTVSGQIDMKPTILHLLGIKNDKDIRFGSNLFAKGKESFAVLRDGSYITADHVYTNSTCYSKENGLEVDFENCEPYMDQALTDLKYSDKIIYGDLLRFFNKRK